MTEGRERKTQLVDVLRARLVFVEKVMEQARHVALIFCVIYSADKQEDVHWLMLTIHRTLDQASSYIVPGFYIGACMNTYNALTSYFHLIVPYTRIQGHENSSLIVVLCKHSSGLLCLLTTISLHALGSMSEDNSMQMTKALLVQTGFLSDFEPCPSEVFQEDIQRILSSDAEGATKLLDMILNQLNWLFRNY